MIFISLNLPLPNGSSLVRFSFWFSFENVTSFKEATKVGKGTQTHHRTSKSLVIYKDSHVSFQSLSFGKLSLFVKWQPFIFWFSKDFKVVIVNNGWHKICSLLEQAFNPYVVVVLGNVIHEFYGEMVAL